MHTTELMPAMRESAQQTAARLRRSLRQRWPAASFSVRTTAAAEIRVTWTGGPSADDVAGAARGYARTLAGRRQEPTLWIGPRGGVALVWPGAERVVIEHRRRGDDVPERRTA